MTATVGLLEYCDPRDWSVHHFGLPAERWNALAGKVFWVTGAGTGFGAAIATILAVAGGRPVLTGRRREKLEETREAMRGLGVDPASVTVLSCDVRDEVQVAGAADEIANRFGILSGLVVCAALPQSRSTPWPLADLRRENWQSLLDSNLTAPWLTARAALPLMLGTGQARVLLLTSEAGWAGTPGFGPYNVSKAALNSLGASLAAETAARHPAADVQINVLNPGEARSEMNQGSTVSPYTAVAATLALLSHPPGGPNGRFFARDGRHLEFAYSKAWEKSLLP
ncbi:SDR family oxidoreductase [Bradyrhizobium sp.]|uniref:SDR family NAD(P)-dependent oxidoreductase n=1 Tax=Bradyrhizobium sp. TaxID=376 RepID=UPI00262AABBC|nr:SDR family oxidoreductase [Bradyrhizobium sp.]